MLAKVETDLAMVRANLAQAKTDLALDKGKMEVEVTKAKEELAKAKKEAKDSMDKYKTSKEFAERKAQVVAAFLMPKELYDDHLAFCQEAFKKGYELGKFDCCTQIVIKYQELDLTFLNERKKSDEEPFHDSREAVVSAATSKVPLVKLAAMFKTLSTEPATMSEPPSMVPTARPKPSSAKDMVASSRLLLLLTDPKKKLVRCFLIGEKK